MDKIPFNEKTFYHSDSLIWFKLWLTAEWLCFYSTGFLLTTNNAERNKKQTETLEN